jgi:general secretion pathway protein G
MNQKQNQSTKLADERGLTLIEIIIVLVILSLVMSFLAGKLFGMGDVAKAELTRTKMASIKEPIYLFQMRENTLPSDLNTAGATDPTDGWGKPIQYRLLDGTRSYELKSLGADGREGGTGSDADIIVKGP